MRKARASSAHFTIVCGVCARAMRMWHMYKTF